MLKHDSFRDVCKIQRTLVFVFFGYWEMLCALPFNSIGGLSIYLFRYNYIHCSTAVAADDDGDDDDYTDDDK